MNKSTDRTPIKTTILWDIENVTPSSGRGTRFVENLINFMEENGNVSFSTAFGDWTRRNIKKIGDILAGSGFELIHVPKSKKNSADISLITHATEMIFLYPHLQRYVIITGDADFRPLLLSLKKHGKEIWIICDSQNASEELLALADKFLDYRSILQGDTAEKEEEVNNDSVAEFSTEAAFELFEESILLMEEEGKIATSGSIKVKMKLLNEDFDEKIIGFSKWSAFLHAALQHTKIRHEELENGVYVFKPQKDKPKKSLPKIFTILLDSLETNDWVLFPNINRKLLTMKVDIRKFGYNKFKKLILDAEKRGIIETKNDQINWYLRKKKKERKTAVKEKKKRYIKQDEPRFTTGQEF